MYAYRCDLDLARSREALVTAREEERRRLSRDLHDDLGPALAGIALGLRAAANTVHRGAPGDVAPLLDELAAQATAAADDVRRIARNLRPQGLTELGLVGAIQQRVDAVRSTGQLAVELSTPDEPTHLPAAVEAAAYRVVVEALTNTLRHARAQHCWISIKHNGNLMLEVSDDGIGLPAQRHHGVGLSAMEERAAQLGGSLYVGNRIPRGTTIRLTLPSTPSEAIGGGGRD